MEALDNWQYLPALQLLIIGIFFFVLHGLLQGHQSEPVQSEPVQSDLDQVEESPVKPSVKSPSHQRALNTKADQRGPSFGKYETKQAKEETDFVQWNVVYTK